MLRDRDYDASRARLVMLARTALGCGGAAAGKIMPEYHVEWEIEVQAESPEDAAKQCRMTQLNPNAIANVFKVADAEKGFIDVDLDELEWSPPEPAWVRVMRDIVGASQADGVCRVCGNETAVDADAEDVINDHAEGCEVSAAGIFLQEHA